MRACFLPEAAAGPPEAAAGPPEAAGEPAQTAGQFAAFRTDQGTANTHYASTATSSSWTHVSPPIRTTDDTTDEL